MREARRKRMVDRFLFCNLVEANQIQSASIQTLVSAAYTIQYKHEYYYSGINPVEFRGHSKRLIILKLL